MTPSDGRLDLAPDQASCSSRDRRSTPRSEFSAGVQIRKRKEVVKQLPPFKSNRRAISSRPARHLTKQDVRFDRGAGSGMRSRRGKNWSALATVDCSESGMVRDKTAKVHSTTVKGKEQWGILAASPSKQDLTPLRAMCCMCGPAPRKGGAHLASASSCRARELPPLYTSTCSSWVDVMPGAEPRLPTTIHM